MRYAIRQLRKSPGFSIAAILILGLGIGAITALFSVVSAVLLKQLPFAHAQCLVWIWSTRIDRDKAFYSVPDFVDTRRSAQTLNGIAAYANWGANLTDSGEAERFAGARISAYAFDLMGVRALRGRTLVPGDDGASSERVVVLTYGLWQRRFGGDPRLIGQKLTLNGDSYTVVGVLPAAFVMPASEAELFVPLVLETDPFRSSRGMNFLRVFARLRPGSTERQAAAELAAISRRLRETHPDTNGKHTDPRVLSFQDEITGGYRAALWALLGAVGLVLLIACLNLANLQLVRSSARRREVAVRSALGATRFDLMRQFLTESLVLAGLGGALGLVLAHAALRILLLFAPSDLPRATEIALDGQVLAFAIFTTLTAGIIFGLAPAIHAARVGITGELKSRGWMDPSQRLTRSVLVVAEVAVSIVLLVCAGLFLRTFLRTQAVSPGITTDHLLLMRLSLPASDYRSPTSIRNFYDALRERVAALPGVDSVALASVLPLSGMNSRIEFLISGKPPASRQEIPAAQNRWVSAGYFLAMRIPIIEGREFSDRDIETAAGVAVIDQSLAKKYWPNENPLGSHVRMDDRDFEIVGVVGNVKHATLNEEPTATIYAPVPQVTPGTFPFLRNSFSLVVRTSSDPLSLTTSVRRELRRVDANVPASSVKTMDQFLALALGPRKFNLQMITVFASSALLLASLGLYGVISHSVSLRTAEIGIRMALGADAGIVLRLIVGQALRLVLFGIAAGLLASMVAARGIEGLLFETSATDPVTFCVVPILFAAVGAAAAYFPARRAAKVDPLIALRSE